MSNGKSDELPGDETDQDKPETQRTELDDTIDEYLTEAHERESTPTMTLYKYDDDKTGKDREQVGYFSGDDIPKKHKIGLLYGGGRYQAYLKQPKGNGSAVKQRNCQFRLSHIYDEQHKKFIAEQREKEIERTQELLIPGSQAARYGHQDNGANQAAAQAAASFVMLKEILQILVPVIKGNQAAAPAAPTGPQGAGQLLNEYAIMQKILQRSLFDQAATYKSFMDKFQNFDGRGEDQPSLEAIDGGEPEKKEPGIMDSIERIIKMISPFFDLLAQHGTAGKLAAQTARAAPQFMEIVKDPNLCRLIVQYFDKTKGIEKSNIALQNLGINRAALFSAVQRGTGTNQGSHAPRQPQPAAAHVPAKPGKRPTARPVQSTKNG